MVLTLILILNAESKFVCQNDNLCECKNESNAFTIQCKNGRLMKLKMKTNNPSEIDSIYFEKIGPPLTKKDFENYTEIKSLRFSMPKISTQRKGNSRVECFSHETGGPKIFCNKLRVVDHNLIKG